MANKIQLSQEQIDTVIDLYCNKKYGQQKVAKLSGVPFRRVRQILIDNNIHIRNFAEAAKSSATYRRLYNVNDNYFDIQSSNMAYILGFLAADGTVAKDSNQIKIGLSSIDEELLIKINKEIQNERPLLSYVTDNGFNVTELKFTSEHIKSVLSEYNIIPRKTYTFKWPEKLKLCYYIDFIRGYFDGDGSVSTAGNNAIRFQICGHQRDFLSKIVQIFAAYGIKEVNVQSQKREKDDLYYIQYSTNSTRKIFELLYYDDCLCLQRKYEKYKTLVMK